MAKSTSEIVYDQAVRAVEQQVKQLDELRTRTAVVLAASGVVTGFLGRTAIEAGLGPFGYCAVAAFALSALGCRVGGRSSSRAGRPERFVRPSS